MTNTRLSSSRLPACAIRWPWRAATCLGAFTAWIGGATSAFAQAGQGSSLPVTSTLKDYPVAAVMASVLVAIVVIMAVYGVRHFVFTMNRLTGVQRHPYMDISVANWPMVTVFIAAHNEEKVIAG
ncbi:MAG: hypothetical protein H7332_16325, partial [Bdellovibrionales bacterium]|nr:hypothetical protein [Ramlibacter sp.]